MAARQSIMGGASYWMGEQGPSVIIDQQYNAHREKAQKRRKKQQQEQQQRQSQSFVNNSHLDYQQRASRRSIMFNNFSNSMRNLTSPALPSPQLSPNISSNNLRHLLQRRMSEASIHSYGSVYDCRDQMEQLDHLIRFQVVIWSISPPDITLGRVEMKFRVTIFWNDVPDEDVECDETIIDTADDVMSDADASTRNAIPTYWSMQGRNRAVQCVLKSEKALQTVDVPPISLLNVETFSVIGSPEVSMLRKDDRLMRWTCLYKANLLQEHMQVDHFPHDEHDLCVKIGILQQRQPGARWDRNKWKLSLATEYDSQGSTAKPHGLLVESVKIPNFSYNKNRGLEFEFMPLGFGSMKMCGDADEKCLNVKVTCVRDSGYYDNNIMPTLILLNIAAVSILLLKPDEFFQRGLLTLNISFVQIGMRNTLDSKLPSVSYQIKMQRILNHLFYALIANVLEGALVFYLYTWKGWSVDACDKIDKFMGVLSLFNILVHSYLYYSDLYLVRQDLMDK